MENQLVFEIHQKGVYLKIQRHDCPYTDSNFMRNKLSWNPLWKKRKKKEK